MQVLSPKRHLFIMEILHICNLGYLGYVPFGVRWNCLRQVLESTNAKMDHTIQQFDPFQIQSLPKT